MISVRTQVSIALQAVREQRKLNLSDVANFIGVGDERLQLFEAGELTPTRKQIEKLARTYGVPEYSLYSGIPNTPTLPLDFRRRDPTPATVSPRGLRSILFSEQTARFARQLAIETKYEPSNLISSAMGKMSPKRRADVLRSAIASWIEPRHGRLALVGAREQVALGTLRLFMEIHGIVLSVNAAPPEDYMGFFLRSDGAMPSIFINRQISSKKAQLFTLAHEIGHALMGTAGISNPFIVQNSFERECNKFAAELLAPIDEFQKNVEALSANIRRDLFELIRTVSANSLLSHHAAAIRLVETDYITQADLQTWVTAMVSTPRLEKDEETEGSEFGVPHAKRLSEIGHLPIVLASLAVKQGIIDSIDVQSGIGLSESLQSRAFSLAARRFEIATK